MFLPHVQLRTRAVSGLMQTLALVEININFKIDIVESWKLYRHEMIFCGIISSLFSGSWYAQSSGIVEGIHRYMAYTHFFISWLCVYPLLNPF